MSIRKSLCFLTGIYALAVITLGLMGYRVGSLASLIAGGGLGFLTLISVIFMFMEKKIALYFATFFTLLLGFVFAWRFSISTEFMPGAMALFSAIVLFALILQIYHMNEKFP